MCVIVPVYIVRQTGKLVIEVDDKTYRKMQKQQKERPYSIEEMMLYDEVFDEWDN